MSMITATLPGLVPAPAQLPMLFDQGATYIWALSGSLIAARRGYVGMGIIIIALVSATGGGLLRDGLLLNTTPALLTNPLYVVAALAATALVMVAGRYVDRFRLIGPAVHFVDALGAGAYAVVGASLAIAAGLPIMGVIIVGLVNATGGGLLRDLMMSRVPDLFKPGLPFALASLLAAALFAILVMLARMDRETAGFITIAAIFLFNLVMLRLNIKSRPVEAFRDYWESRE